MSLPPFEQVVREHGEVVLRVCTAVVGPSEAEDVWSETFLAALRAYPRLTPESNVRAWLLTIARNKAIDLHRATQRRPLPLAEPPEVAGRTRSPRGRDAWASTSSAPPDPAVVGEDGEHSSALRGALAELPQRQREAIAYHYVAELPYARVAELLDTSEAAARRSAADGISSLRKLLSKEERS